MLALVLVVALEGISRLVAPISTPQHGDGDWLQLSSERGWGVRAGFRGAVYGGQRSFGQDGLLATDARKLRRRERRILLVGDSRTFGNGVATEDTFAEILDRRLPDAVVINLGVPGYSSFQGLAALRHHLPRLAPQVVVFAFGFNDRRYVLDPRDADGPWRFRRLKWLSTADDLARSLAMVRLLRGGDARALEIEEVHHRPLRVDGLAMRVSPASYRENLEEVARYCAAHDVRLIFLMLNENPRDELHLKRGLRLARQGHREAAERELSAVIATGNVFADAGRRALAGLYRRHGRSQEAAAAALSPRTFRSIAGGYPLLPLATYRAIEGEVAKEHRVEVVRAGAAIDRHPEWYFDVCHFDQAGHQAVAAMLWQALRAREGAEESASAR